MHWNEYDIDEAYDVISRRAPEIEPYARYLRDWKDVVNSNSDGWAHWRAGSRAADKLCRLMSLVIDTLRHGGTDMPSTKELNSSLTPIKSLATKRDLEAPTLAAPPAGGMRL